MIIIKDIVIYLLILRYNVTEELANKNGYKIKMRFQELTNETRFLAKVIKKIKEY